VRWSVAGNFPNLSALHGMLGVQAWGSTSSSPIPAHFEEVNMSGGVGSE
jgi:hypothetical protein